MVFCPYQVFRYGDIGTNWYVCLSGTVDVVVPSDSNKQTDNKIGVSSFFCHQFYLRWILRKNRPVEIRSLKSSIF